MKYNLSDKIIKEIKSIARKYLIKKIILFGSRARGDNKPTSDIDIAVYTFPKFDNEGLFVSEIQDLNTLLKIDIVFLKDITNEKLIANIKEEGVVIYERL
ncbi:nucleotidyltransferase family protein [Paramaledivibacter caminithermalis]|jgi:predicted nucleotidyltransferase|uniref:Predicted nucleotidyltransferase n=1 Tax=Paramaledivibacter caminithermalis (strain DSM 15212 / CIP 107654 / DViRD3) TaxID=1121301 RepID=A0A1M6P5F8_PARC5|nr:nucleotidyltransferase domain-containing protein [Paramaledivibacter caminithermalis]SHK03171.1 Predicted nucleotidyltransferase [Paramaledivibacter caminithermalis DSM 15212]